MSKPPLRLDRALLRLAGPDARALLNGLLTQDVDKLADAPVIYAALLSPQGKLIADMHLWAEPDGGVLIEADPARGADLLRRLSMYKLRSNVTLADVSAENAVLLWLDAPGDDAVADPRRPDGALGWRKIVSAREADALGDPALYQARRIALGIPDLARDAAPEEVFAGEALLEELNGVDFHKGCFVGQENVSRMKRRATTRKKYCPITFEGEAPAPGTPVLFGEVEIGAVRSGVAGRALALLRLDRALEAEAAGNVLTADARAVRLDPPGWLILPRANAEAS